MAVMDPPEQSQPAGPDEARPNRHAGWAVLVGMLGAAFIMIGVVLVAMLQAPSVQRRAVVTGFVLIACGLLLLPLAWRGRHRYKR